MEKKLYIPTTTRNFQNILSSESISPKSFYKERKFGDNRWYSIPENNMENVILLYDTLCYFNRPKEDYEDHPMLIEVTIKEDNIKTLTQGVYYCDRTIYLTPYNSQFIFFCETDKAITLSISKSNIETKLLDLYQSRFIIKSITEKYNNNFNLKDISNLNTFEIEKDISINKMKGLLYGYYIGAILSTSKEAIEKLNFLRYTFNELAGINNKLGLYQCEYRIDTNNIQDEIQKQEDKIEKEYLPLPTKKNEIVVNDKNIIALNTELVPDKLNQKLFKCWINDLLSSKKYNGKINSFRKELSDDITKKARDLLTYQWENSYTQKFLNKLRRHTRGESFDVEWDNGLLSSIAAVIIKGDDWNKLLTFMQTKGMYDYRLAFSMYGALNGFANLTRDFTDLLFSYDSKYIADVYTEFHGQLFGERLDTNLKKEKPTHEAEETSSTQTPRFDIFFKSICTKCPTARKDENSYKKYFQEYGLTPDLLNAIKQDKTLNKGKGVQKGVISDIEKQLNPSNKKRRKQKNEKDSKSFKNFTNNMIKDKLLIFTENKQTVEATAPVIISASRSTDIPAFYAKWFFNRLEKGYCVWYNPFNQEPSYISFKNCKVIVFWTKNPKPIIPYLHKLEEQGIHYYFQVTLNDYTLEKFEPNVPSVSERIETFKELSNRIGKERVIWRFDPLILTANITPRTLLSRIWKIGNQLKGYTNKLVFSFIDVNSYRKVQNNLVKETNDFNKGNIDTAEINQTQRQEIAEGLAKLRDIWKKEGWDLTLATCAEDIDLNYLGIEHNRCIDGELMKQVFSEDKALLYYLQTGVLPEPDIFGEIPAIPLKSKNLKDKGQRKLCGCMVSKDIGMYNTCKHLCVYCYANTSRNMVLNNESKHSDNSESIIK